VRCCRVTLFKPSSSPSSPSFQVPFAATSLLKATPICFSQCPSLERRGLPSFEFHLDDISHIPGETLRARAFDAFATVAVAALNRSHESEEALLQALAPFADLFAALVAAPHGARALAIIFEYLSRVAPRLTPQGLAQALAPYTTQGQDILMNIVDQLRQEGRQEGQAEGRALSVLKLMKLKFGQVPVEIERTVSAAPAERLDTFLERILTAASFEDVVRE